MTSISGNQFSYSNYGSSNVSLNQKRYNAYLSSFAPPPPPKKNLLKKIAPWAIGAAILAFVDLSKIKKKITDLFKTKPTKPTAPTTRAEKQSWLTTKGFDHKFGHLNYSTHTLDSSDKVIAVGSKKVLLHQDAAKAWATMQADAKKAGIELDLNYGYRSEAEQKKLFDTKVASKGSEAEASKTVAPDGYSEHQTGFAIDVFDGKTKGSKLFKDTDAYTWLKANAATYGFEQSFKAGNKQGVSDEAWHWRFIKSPAAKAVFAQADMLNKTPI